MQVKDLQHCRSQVGDMNQQAAVGTTVALLERGSRVCQQFTKDYTLVLKQEFKLLAEVFKTYLTTCLSLRCTWCTEKLKFKTLMIE